MIFRKDINFFDKYVEIHKLSQNFKGKRVLITGHTGFQRNLVDTFDA